MALQEEIDTQRKEIHTDGYPMSIGELLNLYRDGELDLHPEFQRFYRWTPVQKSRWIESILLGIPLPSIFVVQRADGVWDVIDGLQRLSTILELMGELRGEDGQKLPPLTLEKTKHLPSLEGKRWKDDDEEKSLTVDQQRFIKRAKLDVKIILRESHESAKYELFQRLNTGGSMLSDQEVRSAILIGVNHEFYKWLAALADSESFRNCLPITDRQIQEQYDLELAVRFVVLRTLEPHVLPSITELGDFLTDRSVALAMDKNFDYAKETAAFNRTFELLATSLESDSFRKYDRKKDRFSGAFLISAFEVIALGLGYNFEKHTAPDSAHKVTTIIKGDIWSKPDFLTSSGIRATQRLPKTIPFGREVFDV